MNTQELYARFTDRARKVMQLAKQEAQRFGHASIGTEHILLGLSKEGSGVAAYVLNELGMDLREIRLAVAGVNPSPKDDFGVPPPILPMDREVEDVIQHSIAVSRELNHNYVGTEHILLGLLREKTGAAAMILNNLTEGRIDKIEPEVLNLLGKGIIAPNGWRNDKRASETPDSIKLQKIANTLLKNYTGLLTAEQALQEIRLEV